MSTGRLTFFCGKMGSGKSTRAIQIAQQSNAVLISEDEWLASLYPAEISSLADYIAYAARLKPPIKQVVQSILSAGTPVVMDFPANTLSQREWFRGIFSEIGALHDLVYIDLPDEVCLEQIAKRRTEQPERASTDTAAMFHQVTPYFKVPTPEEEFHIIHVVPEP